MKSSVQTLDKSYIFLPSSAWLERVRNAHAPFLEIEEKSESTREHELCQVLVHEWKSGPWRTKPGARGRSPQGPAA